MTRKRKLDPYGNLLFHLEIKNHWTPKVIDYEDEELRNRLVNPDEIIKLHKHCNLS